MTSPDYDWPYYFSAMAMAVGAAMCVGCIYMDNALAPPAPKPAADVEEPPAMGDKISREEAAEQAVKTV